MANCSKHNHADRFLSGDDLKGRCKICRRLILKQHYQRHKEKVLKKVSEYRKKNPEKIEEIRKKYQIKIKNLVQTNAPQITQYNRNKTFLLAARLKNLIITMVRIRNGYYKFKRSSK